MAEVAGACPGSAVHAVHPDCDIRLPVFTKAGRFGTYFHCQADSFYIIVAEKAVGKLIFYKSCRGPEKSCVDPLGKIETVLLILVADHTVYADQSAGRMNIAFRIHAHRHFAAEDFPDIVISSDQSD